MGSSKKVTVGYKYYLGMHMVLCHGPVDSVNKITVDNKTAWEGTSTGGTITINSPNLFGGESREGGVSGPVDVLMGASNQARNAYLQAQLGNDIPAFRGVLSVVLNQVYVGLNPYLKRWAFWAKRINVKSNGSAQWYLAKAAIGNDMNPAHIVRECLTDEQWGMGYAEADIDDTYFTEAADTLYTEGMGISILWDRSMPLDEFIGQILKHIDAVLYVARDTGKFRLRLVRNVGSIGSLPVLDEDSIERVTDFKRNTADELTNEVTVVYWDAATGKKNSVTVQDIALIAQQGAVVGTTVQYPGFTSGTVAAAAASRDLKSLSSPLASCTVYVNREAAKFNIGEVFVMQWPEYGLQQVAMRVLDVELGTLDSNLVKLMVIEDVFSLSQAIYSAPPPSGWVNPVAAPSALPYRIVLETPYWDLVRNLSEADMDYMDPFAGYLQATGSRPSGDALSFDLHTKYNAQPDSSYAFRDSGYFCPTATLTSSVGLAVSSTLSLTAPEDLDLVELNTYAVIGTEYVLVTGVNIGASTVTVSRGVLDTVPQVHAAGTRIFFVDGFQATDETQYLSSDVVNVKMLPITGQGTLAIASAPANSLTFAQRQNRPYPPGFLRLNGVQYPASVSGNTLTVVWEPRNRLQQTESIITQSHSGISPEAGVTYNIRFYDGSTNALRESVTGITGTAHAHTLLSDILLLHFDGTNGSTTFTDDVGNTFTAYGNAQLTTTDPKFGTACGTFDGTGDYIDCPANASFSVGTDDFTLDFWVKTTRNAVGQVVAPRIISPRTSTNGAGGLQVWQSIGAGVDTNGNALTLATPTGTAILVSTVDAVNDGNWHHVAFCRAGGTLRSFLDGALKQSVSDSTSFTLMGTEGIKIGVRGDLSAESYFNGQIDELRFVKTAIYTAAFTPPSAAGSTGIKPSSIRVELEAVRGGLVSWQTHNITANVT